jgi:hypothetical protein
MKEISETAPDFAPEETGATPVAGQEPKSRKTFARIKVELSAEELASPGVQKMIVEELGRSQEAIASLECYRDKFYAADKELGIQVEKHKKNVALEIISGGTLTVGAAAIGYAPSLTSLPFAGYIAVSFAVVLILIGVIAKGILLK